jgi:hypothetical protein
MRVGLTFDEFVDLRLKPMAGADQAFFEAADEERNEMFPMATTVAAMHLRQRGYECKAPMLDLLVEDGVVKLSKPDNWTQKDVDAAAEHLEDCQLFVPYAAMCQAMGCPYADFLRPLREAAERESKTYNRRIPEDDQYFVMHRVPPRGVTDKNGNLVEITPSKISFTLCDDIRERILNGEEV